MSSLADSILARVAKQRDLMLAATDECRSTKVRVTSKDKAVSVEVDAYGAMTGLWLTSQAQKLGADALAALIVQTAAAAAQAVLERQGFLTGEFSKRFSNLRNEPLRRWDGTMFTPEPGPSPSPSSG